MTDRQNYQRLWNVTFLTADGKSSTEPTFAPESQPVHAATMWSRWPEDGGLFMICSDGAFRSRPERDAHQFVHFGEHYPKFMARYGVELIPRPSESERMAQCRAMLPMHFDRGLSTPPRIEERSLSGVKTRVHRYPVIVTEKTLHAWLMAAKVEAVAKALVRNAAAQNAASDAAGDGNVQ